MKIYKTNSCLSYREYAFLIRLDKTERGYNYLVVDTNIYNRYHDDYYIVGEITELEGIYIEESDYNIKESPLHNNFLFKYFVENELKIDYDKL